MNIDRLVIAFAGIVIILSVVLSNYHSAMWSWLTLFVGLNLLQSAFTKFCPLAILLALFGVSPGSVFLIHNDKPKK